MKNWNDVCAPCVSALSYSHMYTPSRERVKMLSLNMHVKNDTENYDEAYTRFSKEELSRLGKIISPEFDIQRYLESAWECMSTAEKVYWSEQS